MRQLVNACRRLTIGVPGREIQARDIPAEFGGGNDGRGEDEWSGRLADWARQRMEAGKVPLLERALPDFERTLIRVALERAKGHRQEAARLLGWGRNTLTRKIREFGMD